MMTGKGIVLRYFDGCPNSEVARTRLQEALARLGETRSMTLERVETLEEADELGFRGSPTILIDGKDPFEAAGPTGLSCRVYRTEAGFDGAPSVEQLTQVLKQSR